MKNKKLLRTVAAILTMVMLLGVFAGCGKENISSTISEDSSLTAAASSQDATSEIGSADSGDSSSVYSSSQEVETSSQKPSSSTATTSTAASSGGSSSSGTSTKPQTNTSSSKPTSSTQTSSDNTSSEEDKNVFELLDFTVEVKEGKEPVVLQLTDTQIMDSAQRRTANRIGPELVKYWATDKMDERCFNYLTETINAVKPDLILLTGDITNGEFDDNGTALQALIKHMDSFKIPWAPIIGNHEGESKMGIDWYCQQLENSKYCLFKQNQEYNGSVMTGNGNYTVGIKQGDNLTRVFFMMDSNGYSAMSPKTRSNGHSSSQIGFTSDQKNWCRQTMLAILSLSKNTKFSLAYHINMAAFRQAFSKYGTGNYSIDNAANKAAEDFGYVGYTIDYGWDENLIFYNELKNFGMDSMFVGHIHRINAAVKYDGVYFVFGQKSSTYDTFLAEEEDGAINGGYPPLEGSPLVGGTVIKLSTSGAITGMNNYICKNAGSAK